MRGVEDMEKFIEHLKESGYPYQVHDCEDTGKIVVTYKAPAKSGATYNGKPLMYEKAKEFARPMFTESIRKTLRNAMFPEKFIDEVMRDNGVQLNEVIDVCELILNTFPSSAILIGDTGIGKTFGCVWLAKELFRERKILTAQFVRATEINKQRHDDAAGSRWDYWFDKKVDFLVLDDLGTESRVLSIHSENQDKMGLIWELVDYRYSNKLPMMITTNLTKMDLQMRYGERFVSRAERWGIVRTLGEIEYESK